MNGAGAGFVTKIPHLVHLRGHALQQCSMAVFNPQFQRTRYQGRHGSNSSSCNMNIQDALDLHLKEEAFRIIGKDFCYWSCTEGGLSRRLPGHAACPPS